MAPHSHPPAPPASHDPARRESGAKSALPVRNAPGCAGVRFAWRGLALGTGA